MDEVMVWDNAGPKDSNRNTQLAVYKMGSSLAGTYRAKTALLCDDISLAPARLTTGLWTCIAQPQLRASLTDTRCPAIIIV